MSVLLSSVLTKIRTSVCKFCSVKIMSERQTDRPTEGRDRGERETEGRDTEGRERQRGEGDRG